MKNLTKTQKMIQIKKERECVEQSLKELRDSIKDIEAVLTDKIRTLKKEEDNARAEMEKEAINIFKEIGDKKFLGGFGIRETKSFKYDKDEALNWAISSKLFLKLDNKAFEKAIPALQLPWVTTEIIPKMTVPSTIKEEELSDK